jgi:hypothetical protein
VLDIVEALGEAQRHFVEQKRMIGKTRRSTVTPPAQLNAVEWTQFLLCAV